MCEVEQADGGNEAWFTSANNKVEETRGLLARSRDAILQLKKKHREQLAAIQVPRSSRKAQVTDLTG